MEETNKKKVNLSSIFLIIASIVIIVCGIFIYILNDDKNKESKKVNELQSQVEELNKTINDLKEQLNSNNSNNQQNDDNLVELSEAEKNELYQKAITNHDQMISYLLPSANKGYITDEDIIRAIPYLGSISFSESKKTGGFFEEASIADIKRVIKEMFGKDIDIESVAKNNDRIEINGSNLIVESQSNPNMFSLELISIETITENEYAIRFKYTDDDSTETYTLTVRYNNGNVVYEKIEK